MLKFITHRPLWLNILVAVLLAIGLFCIGILSLNWLTHHGDSVTVPYVTGKKYDVAKKQLTKMGFDVEIQDSIYIDTLPPLVVIKQIPEGDEAVKSSRTVYLTINRSVAPLIDMPNLVGYSFRNAEMTLKNNNLKFGDTTFKPDFAKNSVLEQLYNGSPIAPGTKLRMGSKISFVLGDGVGDREFAIPNIVGMRFEDAKMMLEKNGIVIGTIVPADAGETIRDTLSAYISKQNPERFDDDKKIQHIRSGQTMDVWLQMDKPKVDSTGKDDLPL